MAILLVSCGGSSEASPSDDAATDAGDDASLDAADAAPQVDAGSCPPAAAKTLAVDPATSTELTVSGDVGSTAGLFDPAIVWPAGAPTGVMSYSSVPSQDAVFTRVATSSDAGKTWTWAADVNAPEDVTYPTTATGVCPGDSCTGRIAHEVSTIAVDPSDDANRRYKIFTHSYFLFPGTPPKLHYEWGYIGMQTAPDAKGPWSAQTKALGWASSMKAVSEDGVSQSLSAIPALFDCVAFTEPSVLATPTTLELALGCASLPDRIRIVQLRSTDHGAHFSYVGALLSDEDANCMGSRQVNAAHLFAVGTDVYLLASTAGPVTGGFQGYDGCSVFRIDDLVKGRIQRDGTAPEVLRRIVGSGGRFTGACTYAEGATSLGYVASSLALESPPRVFRMLSTGVAAP